MGWATGSDVADHFIRRLKKSPDLSEDQRKTVYMYFISALEHEGDWDTQQESMGHDPAFDAAMKELHPDWDSDEP